MSDTSRRRNTFIILAIIIILILLLLFRCKETPTRAPDPAINAAPSGSVSAPVPSAPTTATTAPAEVLTPATLRPPQRVAAGGAFAVTWKGPDNTGDFITIVAKDAPDAAVGNYRETREGPSLELTAPIEPGLCEVRYLTARSRTILGRAPIEVVPADATVTAADEVTLGAPFPVAWTGPNKTDDYITIVAKGAPDAHYGSYVNTKEGTPVTLTAPTDVGDAELRYVAGQGKKILARRPIKVVAAAVTLAAPADAVAGTTIEVSWKGPNNAGDYITVVTPQTPETQYGNYTNTSTGSPLKLLLPIMSGPSEIRYQTGQGKKVLARRPIQINAAKVTLTAPAEAKPSAPVSIQWTGPNNPGDYITIVPKAAPDGQYAAYTNTSTKPTLEVKSPKDPGDAEVRYMTGQGNKVLARIPIKITP